jgi:hypothetical protein
VEEKIEARWLWMLDVKMLVVVVVGSKRLPQRKFPSHRVSYHTRRVYGNLIVLYIRKKNGYYHNRKRKDSSLIFLGIQIVILIEIEGYLMLLHFLSVLVERWHENLNEKFVAM